jgi:Predicted hydrolases or acyltransferases (alpha/beta hydrolase superfamily)
MNNNAHGPRFVDAQLATGIRLRYAEQGDSGGSPIIFLHGYTDSWFSFSRVLPLFEADFYTLALDQRGHGDSEHPLSGYAISNYAADVLALMDAKGFERATIVGHSMGSFIAQRIAINWPHRVSRLVLVGSATRARNDVVIDLHREVRQLNGHVPVEFVREFQESTIYQKLPEDFMRRVVAESLKLPTLVWREALEGLLEEDNSALLARISAPTLILWGDEDTIFSRAEQHALVSLLPNSVLKIYPDTGHALHWERPQEFVKDLKEFISASDA